MNETTISFAVWRRGLAASLVGIALVGIVAGLVHRQDLRHREALLLREGSYVVAVERDFLARELGAVQSDLLFLAQQPMLLQLLDGDTSVIPALEREYAGFARTKPLYDQIRFIDDAGLEVVRVNRRGSAVEIVAKEGLQAKASRYYFREAITLPPGEIFVSPLDLNVERGEIEQPPSPVIRLVTPVTGRSERRGLLVLNYAGAKLLRELRGIASTARGDLMLVNQQGQYLQAPDPRREWGWLLGHTASFHSEYPEAWESIRSAEGSQVQIGGDLFTAQRVPLAAGSAAFESAVVIISRIPMREAMNRNTQWRVVGATLAILIGIIAIAFSWARSTAVRRQHETHVAESEARLRLLSSRLLAAQEEERKSLSRALHDELGQRVTAIALDLKAAIRRHPSAPDPALVRAVSGIEGVLSGLHEVATRIRPSVLDDLGLADALDSLVSEYEERTGIRVEADIGHLPGRLSAEAGENLYRIVQEALSNVAAHAGTSFARVKLAADSERVVLTIEDEGRGFDLASLGASSRLGILGMRERVELLGGAFELRSAPARGTRIRVELPLRDSATTVPTERM